MIIFAVFTQFIEVWDGLNEMPNPLFLQKKKGEREKKLVRSADFHL